jgi:hypothetical protein
MVTASKRAQRASGARPSRLTLIADAVILAGLVGLGAAWITVARQSPATRTVPVAAVTGGALNGTPSEVRSAAATLLEQAVAPGGAGYRFEIVQRATLHARPGGPPLATAEGGGAQPAEAPATHYLVGLVETGHVLPGGFAMEMRRGPGTPESAVDLHGELEFRALVREGRTYRDDGRGWYPTERPPGIGLDPATAALLPRLLRDATAPRDTEARSIGELIGRNEPVVRALTATADIGDIPGIIAVDAASFTELTEPVTLTFDAAGRLSGVVVVARNTRLEEFDLRVVTEIAISYADIPTTLPEPTPLWQPTGLEIQE